MIQVPESYRPRAGRPSAVRVSLAPGISACRLVAEAIEKSVRDGAGLISVRPFFWPDQQRLPAFVHLQGIRVSRKFVAGHAVHPVGRRV